MVRDDRLDQFRTKLIEVALVMEAKGYDIKAYLPRDMVQAADDYTKTLAYFLRVLSGMVKDLYRGDIDESGFVTRMADLIQQQLTRAWAEGMRANDLDPVADMEPEWQEKLDAIILNEYNYVDNFAADIVDAAKNETGWDALLARAELWANRYTDTVNIAILTTKEQKLVWRLGATEEHCDTCAALNGIVAWASEWQLADVHPQSPPNDALDCGGWRCDCSLEPTRERHTPGAFDRIMAAL